MAALETCPSCLSKDKGLSRFSVKILYTASITIFTSAVKKPFLAEQRCSVPVLTQLSACLLSCQALHQGHGYIGNPAFYRR